jgi:hypothetical protein
MTRTGAMTQCAVNKAVTQTPAMTRAAFAGPRRR